MLPTVVIAGRPNVGKSTLFNRLVGRRDAIVSDTPGVTRDRKEGEALLRGKRVRLVDTAGLEEAAPETLFGRMRASSEAAVSQADLVVFVVDDIDGEYERLQAEGVPVVTPIETEPWGERYFQVSDPNGVVVQLVQWVTPPEGAENA